MITIFLETWGRPDNFVAFENDFKNIEKEDISCIFFTSGSSGKPKGVELTYQNVISCAKYQIKNLNYKNKQIFADCHDTGFVMSLVVIFPTVFLKGTFSPLISLSDKLNPLDYFLENKIDNLITVPSFILFNKEKISKLNLDNLILCGENFPYKILNILLKKTKINSIYYIVKKSNEKKRFNCFIVSFIKFYFISLFMVLW